MTNKVLISVLLLCFLQQGSTSKILPGVEQYEIVYPRKLHTVHKRDVERNKEKKYDDTLEYEIKANGEEVILHLEKNKDLLAKDYTETVYSDDGQQITTSPQIKDHCYYEGYIQDDADSTASISTCTGLSGYFETRGQKYLIEPLGSSDRDEHAVYEYEKLREDEPIKTCGVVNSSWDVHSKYRISDIFKSSNSPEMKAYLKAKKYLEVYIVADNTMCYTVLGLKAVPDATKSEIYGYFNSHKTVRGKYKKYNQDVETVRQKIFGIVNYINTVYKAINIYVALIGLEIWTDNDKCLLSRTAGFTLDSFSKWRNSDLLKRKRNDNAQLITGYDFEGTTIGLAFLKSICSDVYSAGIIQDHSRNEIAVGATMAHEMGHNLGMSHDTKACICSAKVCIMTDTVSSIIPKVFSSCSLQDFEKYMLNDMPKCLTNIPDINTIVAPPTCGNGFVEKGEECDCGTAEECTNTCCNPETCKLTAGSKCAHGECCENCQYKAAGAVCRAVKDECDLPEMCTGYSGNCPSDRFRMNGHPCNEGEGFCYMGNCPTREQQCKAAFGPQATEGAASCYRMNERGVYYGYCKKKSGSHIPCKRKDIMCGKLFCTGGQEMPTYGSLVTFESCKASFPRDGEGDLGMILNGTKCGDGMVCSNGECVSAEDVFRSSDCSAKCPGHAVCDHELQCQCEEGWAPPTCDSSSAVTSFAIIAVVLVILTVTIIAAALLIYFRVFKKSRQTRRGPGATNQVFVDQEHGEHPGLAIPAQKMNDKKLLLPVPPPQENKPQLRSPIIRPKGPPPPIPSTKPASSHTQELFAPEKKPACLPVPKGKPPPPPKALKPPVNPRV